VRKAAPAGGDTRWKGGAGREDVCTVLRPPPPPLTRSTPLTAAQVAAEMAPFLFEHFGNPSSGHAFARPVRVAAAAAQRHAPKTLLRRRRFDACAFLTPRCNSARRR
jgi:hypothetical protein